MMPYQHVDEAGDHRRDRERQIDERDQHLLSEEIEFGDGPRRGDPEQQVERHSNGRHEQRETDGGLGVRLGYGREVHTPAFAQRLDEDDDQREQQEHDEER